MDHSEHMHACNCLACLRLCEQETTARLDRPQTAPRSTLASLEVVWLMPIQKQLSIASRTAERPLAEITMPEVAAWLTVLGYGALTGFVVGRLVSNLLAVALGMRQ